MKSTFIALRCIFVEFLGDRLAVVDEVLPQVYKERLINFHVKQSRGHTSASRTTSSTDPVNVVDNIVGGMVVDDVGYSFDVDTSSSHVCANEDV